MSPARRKRSFGLLFVVTALLAGALGYWGFDRYLGFADTPLAGLQPGQTLLVEPGDSLPAVLRKLHAVGATNVEKLQWQVLARELGAAGRLQVGEYALDPGITPRLLRWPTADIAARVDELMGLVRLDDQAHRGRLPHELSGGQRQRVGVARALAAKPRIVLMDEPFGALDPLTRTALGEDYRALHDRLGLTTVMITHDMAEAVLLADRIAVMRGGRILAHGTPAELMQSGDAYVGELLQTPRRQAERLQALLPRDAAT